MQHNLLEITYVEDYLGFEVNERYTLASIQLLLPNA